MLLCTTSLSCDFHCSHPLPGNTRRTTTVLLLLYVLLLHSLSPSCKSAGSTVNVLLAHRTHELWLDGHWILSNPASELCQWQGVCSVGSLRQSLVLKWPDVHPLPVSLSFFTCLFLCSWTMSVGVPCLGVSGLLWWFTQCWFSSWSTPSSFPHPHIPGATTVDSALTGTHRYT